MVREHGIVRDIAQRGVSAVGAGEPAIGDGLKTHGVRIAVCRMLVTGAAARWMKV
jgi:hypothetical protein